MKTVRLVSFYRPFYACPISLACSAHAHIPRAFSPPTCPTFLRVVSSLLSFLSSLRSRTERRSTGNAIDTARGCCDIRSGELHGLRSEKISNYRDEKVCARVVSDTKPVPECANPYGVPFLSLFLCLEADYEFFAIARHLYRYPANRGGIIVAIDNLDLPIPR